MDIKEALMRLGFEDHTNVYSLDETIVKKHYRDLSKRLHPDYNNNNDEDFKKLKDAYDIIIKLVRENRDKPNPQYAIEYEYYKEKFNALKSLNRIKYYPDLSMKRYLELYAAARNKKRQLGGDGLELYQIIEQYCTDQENRDARNKHLAISFEQYFELYIRYHGVINLDKHIEEYASMKQLPSVLNINLTPFHLNMFLSSKMEKTGHMVR